MTEDLSDISADGIWNMVEYPVLQQDGNVISIDTISANSQTFKSRGLTLGVATAGEIGGGHRGQ
jgi:hypothetical protein